MKYLILLGLICCDPQLGFTSTNKPSTQELPKFEVYFQPHGNCAQRIIDRIDSVDGSVRVQAYGFTSVPIGNALIRAKNRGITVQIILDKSEGRDKNSMLNEFKVAEIDTYLDHRHAIAHNKVIILKWKNGQEEVIGGSYNYTNAAENSNAENCLFIRDVELTDQYMENWNLHLSHSEKNYIK